SRKIDNHQLQIGGSFVRHEFNPNIINTTGDGEGVLKKNEGQHIRNYEFGAYVSDDIRLSKAWQLNGGVRLSGSLVPGTTYL
ncbi:hypothetical protein OFO29_42010, partial [Escherichia coli]|nr:hypothetical protein [Escherichia coli]